MKTIAITLIALIAFSYANAQVWLDFGLKAGPNSSMLVNNNIFNDKTTVHEWPFGHNLGFRVGTNVGDRLTFSFEYQNSELMQRWRMNDDNGNKFWREFDIKHRDLLGLMRIHSDGSYVEIGAQFSKINSAHLENWGDTPPGLVESGNVKDYFVDNYNAAVFGFGLYMIGNGNLNLIMGFRASYALNDILAIDQRGGGNTFPAEYKTYDDYAPLKPLQMQLIFELNYDIGYLVSPACKTRSAFIFF